MAYIWDTDTNSLQESDIMLFIVTAILVILVLLLLTVILPKLSPKLENWDTGGLTILFVIIAFIEIWFHLHYIMVIKARFYSVIRYYLGWTMMSVPIVGCIIGTIMSCCYGKKICNINMIDNFASAYMFGACFAVYILPILIEASIYPTEIISSLGIIVTGVISIPTVRHILLKRFINNHDTDNHPKASKKCCYYVQIALVLFTVYLVVPIVTSCLLLFYLSLLRVLLESPTSQIIQILLAFLPSICVGFGSYALNKILGNKGDKDKPDSRGKSETDSEDNKTNHTSEKARKKHQRNTRANEQTDSLSHDCVSTNSHHSVRRSRTRPQQDDSSQEIHLLVEVHQDNNSETEDASSL